MTEQLYPDLKQRTLFVVCFIPSLCCVVMRDRASCVVFVVRGLVSRCLSVHGVLLFLVNVFGRAILFGFVVAVISAGFLNVRI